MKSCNQCGKCCIKYSDGGLSASPEEIAWWDHYKPEIYQHTRDGKIWVDPQTGKSLSLCPWLYIDSTHNRHMCSIYQDRPDDCKYYPVTIEQMISDQCEMLEEQDLANPVKTQKTLDNIMADSRPAIVKKR